MGKTTSRASSATVARSMSRPSAAARSMSRPSAAAGASRSMVRSGFGAGWATRCASAPAAAGRPPDARAPAITAAAESVDGGLAAMDQRPDLSMNSGTGS